MDVGEAGAQVEVRQRGASQGPGPRSHSCLPPCSTDLGDCGSSAGIGSEQPSPFQCHWSTEPILCFPLWAGQRLPSSTMQGQGGCE